jgi:fructose-1,6-bisphosphatase/inositol monophosphatase family enzyme
LDEHSQCEESFWPQGRRVQLMLELADAARRTGEYVLAMPANEIHDTMEVRQHQYSTVDSAAGIELRRAVQDLTAEYGLSVIEEAEVPSVLGRQEERYPLLVCDAVEGSTNAKRGLSARFNRPILAGVSLMVLRGPKLDSMAASAFYDFASRRVYSAVRGEPGSFIAFADGCLMDRRQCVGHGDSQIYAVVPGYSHDNVEARAEVERRLLILGLRTTGGTRSSAQDLLGIICGEVDAYVDLRAVFLGSKDSRDEVLHTWDVGGILPVLDALDFWITDVNGRGWQQALFREPLTLLAARPAMGQLIMDAVRKVSFLGQDDYRCDSILSLPPKQIGG